MGAFRYADLLQVTPVSNVHSSFFDHQTKVGLCHAGPHDTVRLSVTTGGGGLAMQDVARFSGCTIKVALLAFSVLGTRATYAAPLAISQPSMDCKVYAQQEQANLEALKRADPSIHAERFDTVFYSAKRNSCLASVFFTKGDATYGGILDIVEGRMLWAKSYKGTNFTPANIVEMDEDMDDEIKALEFTQTSGGNSHAFDFLPLLLDRTMNTFPAIKNALTEAR